MNKNIDIEEVREQAKRNIQLIKHGSPAYCPVTGRLLRVYWTGEKFNWDSPNTQLAHLLSNSKANVKKYGKHIIDHELNWCFVSGLVANNDIQIKNRPVLESEIVADITTALLNK